jgi:hypothetical protein
MSDKDDVLQIKTPNQGRAQKAMTDAVGGGMGSMGSRISTMGGTNYRWKPEPIEREVPADMYSAITQALVAAKDPNIGWMELRDGLVTYLLTIEKAKLGLATTAELLTELQARVEVNGTGDYRTAGPHRA